MGQGKIKLEENKILMIRFRGMVRGGEGKVERWGNRTGAGAPVREVGVGTEAGTKAPE